uniref:sex comb on midleg-like protein 1 isoform X3 n=1 Tax=Callithrix jacchus TaxID=9483 RepID=UPI0023DD04F9|nr:sex comb on midleg-like protein 1 isoform X3 [Callithrix jacchus]XP_054106822.1 sex comb on midleg-like protein 1 isoform X3 [Callithrix jacchus]
MMSSNSSEADVIKTRISTYDDDNTVVLHAYETKHKFANETKTEQEPITVADASCNTEEQPKSVYDVLTYCQVIYDAIQNLDKKIDGISRKVSKIQRFNAKAGSTNRKPSGFGYGYAYRNYSCLLAKKLKLQKMKKSQAYETFSYSQSYSPTSPVAVRADNSQSNNPAPSFHMEEYQRAEPEEDPVLSCTPSSVHFSDHSEHGFQPSYASDGAMPGSSRPYRGSARVNSSQVTSVPVDNDMYLEDNFTKHPATWSVEAVVLFLKQTDPKTLSPLVDLFRNHEIDGQALLLLTSDVMLKYLGMKLGTVMKLCYYIEQLKQGKCYQN